MKLLAGPEPVPPEPASMSPAGPRIVLDFMERRLVLPKKLTFGHPRKKNLKLWSDHRLHQRKINK